MSKMTKKQMLAEIEKIEAELDRWSVYNGKRVDIQELQQRRDLLYSMLPEE